MALLGIDLGTTATKAVAFSPEGRTLAAASQGYALRQPRPGWAELDGEELWLAVQRAVREVAAACPEEIEALAIASQGEGVVPVDGQGRPLGPFIVSFDRRSTPQAEWLQQAIGAERLFAACGQIAHPMGTATKILWWRQEESDPAARAAAYLCGPDYILRRLGLEPVTDPSMAARTMLYDIASGSWSAPLLRATGITPGTLATIVPAGTEVGTVPARAAGELGLGPGVLAVVGGHDQPCAALGVGAVDPGEVAYSLGTTETLVCVFERFMPALGPAGYACYPHVVPNRFITLAGNFTGGILLQWYRDTFGAPEVQRAEQTGRSAYEILLAEMASEPTDLYVLPHFTATGTPWNDPDGVGLILGLRLDTSKPRITRALLEGVTYEIALNIEHLEALGVQVRTCWAVGGGTRSAALVQLKADVLGRPIGVPAVSEAACWGAALLAGKGIGMFSDVGQTARATRTLRGTFTPDAGRARAYGDRLRTYARLYPAVKALMRPEARGAYSS